MIARYTSSWRVEVWYQKRNQLHMTV